MAVVVVCGDTEYVIHPVDVVALLLAAAIGAGWLCIHGAHAYMQVAHTAWLFVLSLT